MKLLKYTLAIILLVVSLHANSTQEQGYSDGRKAMMDDEVMKKKFQSFNKSYQSLDSASDKYVLVEGFKGFIKGTCMRLTYGDLNKEKYENKQFAYLKAFENGCWSVYSK